MGFAIANVVDPQTGAQVPIIGNFKYMFALLFLLAVDGHHMLLEGIIRSYQIIAVDQLIPPLESRSDDYVYHGYFFPNVSFCLADGTTHGGFLVFSDCCSRDYC